MKRQNGIPVPRFRKTKHRGKTAKFNYAHAASGSMIAKKGIAMTSEPDEPSSPACLAHEANDAYMGFAAREEIASFLNELLEAERAGTGVALQSGPLADGTPYAGLLSDIHRDEARWCAMLLKQLKALDEPASPRVGAFQEKALAIPELPARIAFLNRGQAWVVRKLREMLPKVRDEGLYRDLATMLKSHEVNIIRAEEALKNAG